LKAKTVTFAGKEFTKEQITGTLKLLRYYRDFIRSDKDQAKDPEGMWGYGVMNKSHARHRLKFLINAAVNRKAGIPDEVGRKQTSDYQRDLWFDCRQINHWRANGSFWSSRPRERFRTSEIQKRFEALWEEAGFHDHWTER
jgi:hypothetical protein